MPARTRDSAYTKVFGRERYAEPAPDAFTKGYRTFCGTHNRPLRHLSRFRYG